MRVKTLPNFNLFDRWIGTPAELQGPGTFSDPFVATPYRGRQPDATVAKPDGGSEHDAWPGKKAVPLFVDYLWIPEARLLSSPTSMTLPSGQLDYNAESATWLDTCQFP